RERKRPERHAASEQARAGPEPARPEKSERGNPDDAVRDAAMDVGVLTAGEHPHEVDVGQIRRYDEGRHRERRSLFEHPAREHRAGERVSEVLHARTYNSLVSIKPARTR